MSHVQAIQKLIKSIAGSSTTHSIIIDGPPGWGKTTTAEAALTLTGIEAVSLGAYSTPLHLFNFLFENSASFVIIDDCANLFCDSASMAILKAATWPQHGKRVVRWGSTSSKAAAQEFVFSGKFVMICNSFPETPDGDAIKSRSFVRPIQISVSEAKTLLLEAANDKKRYRNTKAAKAVATFLAERLTDESVWKLSYRTLEMGYDLAKDHPDSWAELLSPKIPTTSENPEKLVKKLAGQKLKVKEQIRIFEESTGLSRRTFFKYRRSAQLSRAQN